MDLDPGVMGEIQRAGALAADGKIEEARALFRQSHQTSIRRADDLHACIAAHFAANAEPQLDAKLRWNMEALTHANAVKDDPRVSTFWASLRANLGYCYLELGRYGEAREHYECARSLASELEEGPHADRVRRTIESQLTRLDALEAGS